MRSINQFANLLRKSELRNNDCEHLSVFQVVRQGQICIHLMDSTKIVKSAGKR
jgi:hypothetical protein